MNRQIGGEETREKGPRTGFHYSRDERIAQRQGHSDSRPANWLRGNRHIVITLIDLVVVLGLLVLYLFFLRPASERAIVGDFRVTGRAFAYGEEVLVSLRIESREDPGTADAPPAEPRQIQISVAGETFEELLPLPGGYLTSRFSLVRGDAESLAFRFNAGDKTGRMTLQIENENVD